MNDLYDFASDAELRDAENVADFDAYCADLRAREWLTPVEYACLLQQGIELAQVQRIVANLEQ